MVSGTGLTHKNSALNRQAMHQAEAGKLTDSMQIYQWGVSLGHPQVGSIGVQPEWFYLTHIQRTPELMQEAVDLAKRGCFVDIDTVDEDLAEKLHLYKECGGPMEKLTVSSDASISGPGNVFSQIRSCVRDGGFAIEELLPLVTSNTATALKLEGKGVVAEGAFADLLVIEKETFELRDVFSKGRTMMSHGKMQAMEKFLEESNRDIRLQGANA